MTSAPVWDALDKSLPGQRQAVRALSAIVEHASLAHAYLFAGPTGAGKLKAAVTLAVAANCEVSGCGACALCLSIDGLTRGDAAHPDIIIARPEGTGYTIEQLREIRRSISTRPVDLATKFLIVLDSDRMREAAANTLLKTVEEPPPNTCIVLLTSRYEAIIGTVKSRCQLIEFCQVAEEMIVGALVGRKKVDVASARVAYHASGGRLHSAEDLLDAPAFAAARRFVGTVVDDLDRRDAAELLADADRLVELIDDLGAVLGPSLEDSAPFAEEDIKDMALSKGHAARMRSLRDESAKRAGQVRKAEGTRALLDLFSVAYRDVLCASSGEDDLVADSEATAGRVSLVRHAGIAGATRALDAVSRARRRISRNVIPKNALAAMLLEIAEATSWRRQSA